MSTMQVVARINVWTEHGREEDVRVVREADALAAIKALEADRDSWAQQADWRVNDALQFAKERDEALAALKVAQEDARRLDWIARQDLDAIEFGLVVDASHDGEYFVLDDRGPFYGKTFREAIDKAMEKDR